MKRPELTTRQAQVAELIVRRNMADKQIAAELGISVETVRHHIEEAAARIPGHGSPRLRIALFFVNLERD